MPFERRFPAADSTHPPRDSSPLSKQSWSLVMRRQTSIGIRVPAAAALMAMPLAAQQAANSKWEGFYAGLNAGGLWSATSASMGENNTGGGFFGQGGGFVGGAQAGYNYLLGP